MLNTNQIEKLTSNKNSNTVSYIQELLNNLELILTSDNNDYKFEESYNNWLDQFHDDEDIQVCGYSYRASEILKNVDPIAYRTSKSDFINYKIETIEELVEQELKELTNKKLKEILNKELEAILAKY